MSKLSYTLMNFEVWDPFGSHPVLKWNTIWHGIDAWRHQMETISTLPALCEGNTPVTSGSPRSFMHYYNNVTWASWRLKSPATRLFLQEISHAKIEGNINAPNNRSFVRGIHRWWPVVSPHKELAMQRRLPYRYRVNTPCAAAMFCQNTSDGAKINSISILNRFIFFNNTDKFHYNTAIFFQNIVSFVSSKKDWFNGLVIKSCSFWWGIITHRSPTFQASAIVTHQIPKF